MLFSAFSVDVYSYINHFAEDKKQRGAAQRSLYYLINGNPNTNSNKGG